MSFRSKLVGAWELIEYKTYLPDDPSNIYHPMGSNAQGIIMYTPDGYMSAQLQTPGVPDFTLPGQDGDWAKVGRNYVAYTGRFFLDEKGDDKGPLLVHEMRNSNLPRLVGDRQRRLCEIKDESEGRFLYLRVGEPIKFGGEDRLAVVRWRRLEDNQETREPSGKL